MYIGNRNTVYVHKRTLVTRHSSDRLDHVVRSGDLFEVVREVLRLSAPTGGIVSAFNSTLDKYTAPNSEELWDIVRIMPAILVGPPQRNEQMWQALKTHILRERQRKKQGVYTVERPVSLLQLEYSIIDIYVNFSFVLTLLIQKVFVYLDRVPSKKLVRKDYPGISVTSYIVC